MFRSRTLLITNILKVFKQHCPSIVVNCAGIHQVGPTVDFPIDAMERIIRLNTTSGIVVAREVVKHWLKRPRPSKNWKIVNIASISSFQGNMENVAYVASKGGVLNMTRGLSNEWAPLVHSSRVVLERADVDLAMVSVLIA